MSEGPGTLIMELNMVEHDETAVRVISAKLLAHYRALDAELHALRFMVGWLSMHGARGSESDPTQPVPEAQNDKPTSANYRSL